MSKAQQLANAVESHSAVFIDGMYRTPASTYDAPRVAIMKYVLETGKYRGSDWATVREGAACILASHKYGK